jgi:hypothetical protein
MLRGIFGPKRDNVIGEWGKLHNEQISELCSSPNIIRLIESRKMRWVGNVARMRKGEVHAGFRWGKLRERDHLEDPDLDWRIKLRWIFRKWDVVRRLG